METFKAYVDKIIYRNEQNGYTVLCAEEDGCETICVGVFQFVDEGEYMEFTGDFVSHPAYGEQFKVESYNSIMPEDVYAIERYLGSGAIKGIGQVTAKRIVEKFGEDSLRILDEEPERLAEIKGISLARAQEIAAQQEEKKDLRKVLLFMAKLGIGNELAVKIYAQYGNAVYAILEENPYKLADDITGIGFKKADEIAFRAGMAPDSDFRIGACIIHVLMRAAGEGHVYLPEGELKQRVFSTLGLGLPDAADPALFAEDAVRNFGVTDEAFERNLMDLAIDRRVIIKEANRKDGQMKISDFDPETALADSGTTALADSGVAALADSGAAVKGPKKPEEKKTEVQKTGHGSKEQEEKKSEKQIFYSTYYYTELGIAKMMHDINLKGKIPEDKIDAKIEKVEAELKITLDELQHEAVRQAANSGVLIITGGPGTGKTTTINAIIKYFEEDYKEIALAAPTGRAAKRMTEATGHEAKTIHRLLDLSGNLSDTSAGARFDYNEDNPLEADLIIIDEMSMVDMFLMSALLRAVSPGTRLILVGDVDQLPSVGAGNVLKDLIESGRFNTVKLNKIFRQAEESDIVVNAHKINRGEKITLRTDSKDFIFIKRESQAEILSAVLGLVRDKLPKYVKADVLDIQVLSPVKRGTLGVEFINKFLQENLNPAERAKKEVTIGGTCFREGDKVMHIKNNYELEWEFQTKSGFTIDRGKGIFNGDIGIIERINNSNRLMEVRFDDGKHVIYDFDQLEEVVLAYAATIHKSQGSEYPAVVLPLLNGPDLLMNRNILYTAVTRAKSCVCIVGTEDAVMRMIANEREQKRYSGLQERLSEIYQ